MGLFSNLFGDDKEEYALPTPMEAPTQSDYKAARKRVRQNCYQGRQGMAESAADLAVIRAWENR